LIFAPLEGFGENEFVLDGLISAGGGDGSGISGTDQFLMHPPAFPVCPAAAHLAAEDAANPLLNDVIQNSFLWCNCSLVLARGESELIQN